MAKDSLVDRQERLRIIAWCIENELTMSLDDHQFIVKALYDIADGENPTSALNVKAKQGERRTKNQQTIAHDYFKIKRHVGGFISSAMAPISDDGLGYTLDEALEELSRNLPYTKETLRSIWNKNKTLRTRDFKLSKD